MKKSIGFGLVVATLMTGCATGQMAYDTQTQTSNPRNLPTVKTPKRTLYAKQGDPCLYKKAVVVDITDGWGEFYTCENYEITRSNFVAAGRPSQSGRYNTPTGEFNIAWQAKEWDSKKYPSTDGTRNMNYASFFHPSGVALHAGSINARSHGCVHLTSKDAQYVYENFSNGDKVIVQSY